jgi:hypothetical protein
MPDSGRGREWRTHALDRLAPIVADVDAPRTTLSWFGLLEAMDEHDGEPFRWTALKARRQIGLPALQELAAATEDHRKMTPLDAVSRVVARLTAVGREGWADRDDAKVEDWLCSIGDGGRAAATRAAVTWVTACRTQVRWPPHDIRARDEGSVYATIRKDVLSLSSRIDFGPWTRPGVIDNSAPTQRTSMSLGYIALTRTIDRGVMPEVVTALHLGSGDRTQIETSDALLGDVLDFCAEAINRWADTSSRQIDD